MRLNNKGMSIIEIVITFALIMFMVIGLFTIVLNYQSKANDVIKKADLVALKTSLTKDIQDDISEYGVQEINEAGECSSLLNTSLNQCINIVFKNGQQKAFGVSIVNSDDPDSIKNKFLYYDGIKYKLKDILPDNIPEGRDIADFQSILISDGPILSIDSDTLSDGTIIKIYTIDVYISYLDFKEDYGIHITVSDKDLSIVEDDDNEEEEVVLPELPSITTHKLKDIVLANNTVNEITASQAKESTTSTGLFKGTENNNETYFFRGNVNNNFVEFAGFDWRIVRINGDGTIRLILTTGISNNKLYPFNVVEENEDETPICVEFSKNSEFCYNKSEYEEMYCGVNIEGTYICSSQPLSEYKECKINQNGEEVCDTYVDISNNTETYCKIKEEAYCDTSNDTMTCLANTDATATVCRTSDDRITVICQTSEDGVANCQIKTVTQYNYYSKSSVKTVIDQWYKDNIEKNTNYSDKVASGNYFCESKYVGITSTSPDFTCSTDVVNSNIGLLTGIEVHFAGYANTSQPNNHCYLYNNKARHYWTMSRINCSTDNEIDNCVFGISPYSQSMTFSFPTSDEKTILPVINLKNDVVYASGNGTINNPYRIK